MDKIISRWIERDSVESEKKITKKQEVKNAKKKKEKRIKPRLHPDTVETLHKRGGSHGTRKGKRGYNRKREKSQWKKQLE